jgi:hypothetical protein
MGRGNITTDYRDPFEDHTDVDWNIVSLGSDDLVRYDGNSAGSSYRVISLSPLTQGTETRIETFQTFLPAIELGIGAHLSQRTLGQELSIELASVEADVDLPADVAITSIAQTTTTLSVTTATPHNLKVGSRIGIRGHADLRANYPALVVATTPTNTTFTATAGPMGTIPSQSLGPASGGFVFSRSAVGGAVNGASMLFENASATNASFYVKSYGSEAIPLGGTLSGNHAVTINTTASIQAANSAANYSFRPTSEYRSILMSDRLQWIDSAVDSLAQCNSRATVTQTLPSCVLKYKLRLRAVNSKSLTVPVAKIVAAVKTGTTTATITTEAPHELTAFDVVSIYGIRDQAASAFPNLTVATAVASVIDALNFTVVIGTAATVTSRGGYVSKVLGGGLPSALGAIAQTVQSVTRTADVLTVVGSATWAGLLIGDYINLYGVRLDLDGSSLGVDGPYRVRDIATTTLTLEPIGTAPTGIDIATTNCGGGVIKRTDLRISFARIYDFERFRVEAVPRAAADGSSAIPVAIQTATLTSVTLGQVSTVGTVTSVTTAGTPAVPATPYFVNSLATTNGALVLTGTSGLHALFATNTGAGAAFVKLYNKATAPTVGTDVPEMIIPVPAAVAGVPGVAQLSPGFNAYRFALGLGIAITGGVADADTTAVAAGQVKVKLSRTV